MDVLITDLNEDRAGVVEKIASDEASESEEEEPGNSEEFEVSCSVGH